MSRNKIVITNLNDTEISTLQEGWKNGKSHAFRIRCQGILMSYHDYDVDAVSQLLSISKQTVYIWFKNWKKYGIMGLITKPGQGRKPILSLDNTTHVNVVEKAVKRAAETGTNMADDILEQLDIEKGFSQRTLRRFLKKKIMPTKDFVESTQKRSMKKN